MVGDLFIFFDHKNNTYYSVLPGGEYPRGESHTFVCTCDFLVFCVVPVCLYIFSLCARIIRLIENKCENDGWLYHPPLLTTCSCSAFFQGHTHTTQKRTNKQPRHRRQIEDEQFYAHAHVYYVCMYLFCSMCNLS